MTRDTNTAGIWIVGWVIALRLRGNGPDFPFDEILVLSKYGETSAGSGFLIEG